MLNRIYRILIARDIGVIDDNVIGWRNVTRVHSLKTSLRGFKDIASEPGFVMVLAIQIITLLLAIGARVSMIQFQIMFFAAVMVFIVETVNTAIEKTVDLVVGNQRHELARKAKDLAGLAALTTGLLWLFVVIACLVS